MTLENKLNITDSVELAHTEEKISKYGGNSGTMAYEQYKSTIILVINVHLPREGVLAREYH